MCGISFYNGRLWCETFHLLSLPVCAQWSFDHFQSHARDRKFLSGFNFLTLSVYRFSSTCIWTDRRRQASSSSSDSPVNEPVDELFGQPVVHVAVDFKQGGKGKEHTAGIAVFWKDRHRLNKLTPLRGDKLTKDKAQLRGILESLTRPPIGMPVGQ